MQSTSTISVVNSPYAGQKDVDSNSTMPHSIEAEAATLGSMIRDNTVVGDVIEVISKDDFYQLSHRIIFDAILNLFDNRRAIDTIILRDELDKVGKLEDAGGVEYLASLLDSVPSSANAVHYAGIVVERAKRRRLMGAATNILKIAVDSSRDVNGIIDEAETSIFNVAKQRTSTTILKVGDILSEAFHKITLSDARDKKLQIRGIPSGFYKLDELTGGFQPAQLIVIASRPSMGKTSLAIKLLDQIGLNEKKSALFFSLEMTGEQIAKVMICAHCGVPYHNISTGVLTQEEFTKLTTAASKFLESSIFIDDTPDLSIFDLRARARRMKAEHDIGIVIVDYLQMVRSGDRRAENRQQEIASISLKLKALAKEIEAPVIALAQLNRSPEAESRKPRMSDLRESGAIEQDADVVMLLHREEVYDTETEKKGICEIIVAKNRTGPTGSVDVAFLKDRMRFENLAQQYA